ncbi:hypothetical protein CHS0354_041524 [Potamilus streckersoni]|uniref:Uncharacterized protein n=1 Tax=Potamilus streckersoni TaxID=2493646 RepID=A0AAE0TA25_9BIVA|nr:hypothetical protein CHS0354_041524 [Potamilus streckersoni]
MTVLYRFPAICLLTIILVSALAHGQHDESERPNNLEQRLMSKLLQPKREKETAETELDTKSDDGLEVSVKDEGNGTRQIDIKNDGQEIERIVQACQSKHEIVIMKTEGQDTPGKCYIHKMGEKQYETDCNGSGEKFERKYDIASEIEDKAFLSHIEGAEVCLERPTFELILAAEKIQEIEDNDKKTGVSKKWFCNCFWYPIFIPYCERYSTSWWSRVCLRWSVRCEYRRYCLPSYCG